MTNKIITLLGFAAKAGKLSFGFQSSVTAITLRKSKLVLTAADISEKTAKEVRFFANQNKIEEKTLKNIDIQALTNAVGRKCGVVSVNDKNFADSIKTELYKEELPDDQ